MLCASSIKGPHQIASDLDERVTKPLELWIVLKYAYLGIKDYDNGLIAHANGEALDCVA